jgi:hypothetical protein
MNYSLKVSHRSPLLIALIIGLFGPFFVEKIDIRLGAGFRFSACTKWGNFLSISPASRNENAAPINRGPCISCQEVKIALILERNAVSALVFVNPCYRVGK